jgi:hypothetical protein
VRVDVDTERRRVRGRIASARQAERVVGHRLFEDRAAGPGVGGEDEMAQRLDEGPFVVDPQEESRSGQPSGAGDGVRPEALDRFPHRTVVTGCPHLSQLHAFRVPPVELALHECHDVDVVDDETADKAGHLDVDEPRVSDLDLAQVTVPEFRAGEVRAREAGTAKRVGAVLVSCHRAILPAGLGDSQRRRAATIQARESNQTPSPLRWTASASRSRPSASSAAVGSSCFRTALVHAKPRTQSMAAVTSGP